MSEPDETGARLRRSLHFVPGADEKLLHKALALEADALVLDLEDAVSPPRKEEARRIVAGWLREADFAGKERILRMNTLDSPWGLADLAETMARPPDAYMVPKPRRLADLETIDREITRLAGEYGHVADGVGLIPISTETPEGVLNLASFTDCPRVTALTWGAEDLSAVLGASRKRDERGAYLDIFRYCRVQTLLCAAAGGAMPIDTVHTDIGDLDGLRRECREAAWMGYQGKLTIHPDQIGIVNEAFTPSLEEARDAEALMQAFEEAQAEGRMTFRFRGQMVDRPHLERARKLLARARRTGLLT